MADAPDAQWLTRIEGALDAHFVQPDGGSRPGTPDPPEDASRPWWKPW